MLRPGVKAAPSTHRPEPLPVDCEHIAAIATGAHPPELAPVSITWPSNERTHMGTEGRSLIASVVE